MRTRRADRQSQYESPEFRDLQERLAANVRRIRNELGWTQEDAAHECGMSTRLLQRCEAGKANLTLTTLARLCAGFEADILDLFEL